MKKLRILIALVVFLSCTVVLPIQAKAKVDLIPIGLNYSVTDVDVGHGFTMTATVPSGSGGTLSWSTSNSYVATVNASGYVFGQHAGTAVITATYTSSGGATASASCTVYVTVADGLYYMKNVSSDLCFYTGGSAVSLQAQQTDASSRVGQLWKIRYVSGGKYEICPIRDTSVALTANDGNYVVVGETETAASWGLIQNANGYAIAYLGSSEEVAKPVVASMPGTQIYLGEWQDALTCHWDLEPAAGLFLRDAESEVLVHSSDVRYMELDDDTATWADLGIICESYGRLVGSVIRSSGDSDVVDFGTNGALEASTRGRVTITVSADLDASVYTQEFDLIVRETISVINLYDSTVSQEILNQIETAVEFVNEVYNDTLYLYFVADGPAEQYENAPIAICKAHGADSGCTFQSCGNDCTKHHKNLERISAELYGFFEENHVVVFWSNAKRGVYCMNDSGVRSCIPQDHYDSVLSKVPGNSSYNRPVIQFLTITENQDYNVSTNEYMSINLAHEIAHTLHLGEVYDNYYEDYEKHDEENPYCVMCRFSDDAKTIYERVMDEGENGLCEYCIDKLKQCSSSGAYEQ